MLLIYQSCSNVLIRNIKDGEFTKYPYTSNFEKIILMLILNFLVIIIYLIDFKRSEKFINFTVICFFLKKNFQYRIRKNNQKFKKKFEYIFIHFYHLLCK